MNYVCRTNHFRSNNKKSIRFLNLCTVGIESEKQTPYNYDLQCGFSNQLLEGLPNKSENIKIGNQWYPTSILELHRPTGKYISRALIKAFNAFSRKGIIRTVGNACAPGLIFPTLEPDQGIKQFTNLQHSCPIISVNTLGYKQYPDSVTVKAEPFMLLKLPNHWSTFDDYINAFSSKYRVRAKKVYEETREITKSYLDQQTPNSWAAHCGSLLAETLQDKTIAIGKNLPELLICYHKSLGENYRVIGFYQHNEIIGFITYIIDDNKMFAMHLGLNKHADKSGKLYQRMLYTLVEEAFTLGITTINLGRTGAEIKSTLGAIPVENSFVVFTRSKVLLFVFKAYVKYFQKKFIYTYRSPFKADALKAPLPA